MLSRWAEEIRCRLLHRNARWRSATVGDIRFNLIWCSECDTALATRSHGHDLEMHESFIARRSEHPFDADCSDIAMDLSDKLPEPARGEVIAIGSRAALAQHGMRTAERRLARWQAAFALSVLAALCLLLSGCLTAQKALVWSDTVTAWGTMPGASQECKRASLDAARYLSNANRHIGSAKGLDDLPSRTEAKRLMDDAAKKCDEKH